MHLSLPTFSFSSFTHLIGTNCKARVTPRGRILGSHFVLLEFENHFHSYHHHGFHTLHSPPLSSSTHLSPDLRPINPTLGRCPNTCSQWKCRLVLPLLRRHGTAPLQLAMHNSHQPSLPQRSYPSLDLHRTRLSNQISPTPLSGQQRPVGQWSSYPEFTREIRLYHSFQWHPVKLW